MRDKRQRQGAHEIVRWYQERSGRGSSRSKGQQKLIGGRNGKFSRSDQVTEYGDTVFSFFAIAKKILEI